MFQKNEFSTFYVLKICLNLIVLIVYTCSLIKCYFINLQVYQNFLKFIFHTKQFINNAQFCIRPVTFKTFLYRVSRYLGKLAQRHSTPKVATIKPSFCIIIL